MGRVSARGRLLAILGSAVAGLTLVVITAAPAYAHAQLESTTPSASTTIAASPKQLSLVFTENVEISPTSVQLFNQKGDRVDIGAPHHGPKGDNEVQADVRHL